MTRLAAIGAAAVLALLAGCGGSGAPRTPAQVASIIKRQVAHQFTEPSGAHYLPGEQVRAVQCEQSSPSTLDCVVTFSHGMSLHVVATEGSDGSFVWHATG